jgi:hypothetical protein
MPRISARLTRYDLGGPFEQYRRHAEQRMERAALKATDAGIRIVVRNVRTAMQSAGLGRLGNGLGTQSDLEERGAVHRYANGGFSASGVLFVRSGSKRSRGAIEAYTQGAEIVPRRGRWLWIATDEIPRLTGRERMTPELYVRNGFEAKIGPLVPVRSVNGNPLLVVKNASVSAAGKPRSAKSLTKRGLPRKGQMAKEFIVAFVGIPRTSRAARVDVIAILQSVQHQLPTLYAQAMGRN